jgi:diacylglycerol kinase
MPNFQHRHHTDSFKSALIGLKTAFSTQPNFKIMLFSVLVVVTLSVYLMISEAEWLVLIVMFLLVFTAEMINTSIEAVVDLVTEEWRQNAKVAKDVSGGMVLLSVFFSIIVGIIIFLPKVIQTASLFFIK